MYPIRLLHQTAFRDIRALPPGYAALVFIFLVCFCDLLLFLFFVICVQFLLMYPIRLLHQTAFRDIRALPPGYAATVCLLLFSFCFCSPYVSIKLRSVTSELYLLVMLPWYLFLFCLCDLL
jgi:hypothetical protein